MFHRLEKWKGKSPKSHLPRPKPSRAVTACGESRIVCFCASLQMAPASDGHCLVLFRFQQFLHPQSTGIMFWQAWTPAEFHWVQRFWMGLADSETFPHHWIHANVLPDMSTKDMTVSNTKPPCPVSRNSEPLGTPRGTPLFIYIDYKLKEQFWTRKLRQFHILSWSFRRSSNEEEEEGAQTQQWMQGCRRKSHGQRRGLLPCQALKGVWPSVKDSSIWVCLKMLGIFPMK